MIRFKFTSLFLSVLFLITLTVSSCTDKGTRSVANNSSDTSKNNFSELLESSESHSNTTSTTSEEESDTFAERKIRYVAFGDSIARGARLNDPATQCYPYMLVGSLDNIPGVNGVDYVNLAVDGQTSEQLLKQLTTNTNSVIDADLITISTGANNILGVMVDKTISILKANGFSTNSLGNTADIFTELFSGNADVSMYQNVLTAFSQINTYISSEEFNAEIDTAAEKLRNDLPEIINLIRKYNKNAVIAVNTIYNPYKSLAIAAGITPLFMPSQITETAVMKLNDVIEELSNELGYIVAQVHDEFNSYSGDERLENAFFSIQSPGSTDIDVHPTENGHKVIAEVVYDAIKKPLKDKLKSEAGVTNS